MLRKPRMEKLSLDFSVFITGINVSTKPELVHRNQLAFNYLFLLQNVCLRSKNMFVLCVETCTSKVKTKKCSFLQNSSLYFSSSKKFSVLNSSAKSETLFLLKEPAIFILNQYNSPPLMGSIQGQMTCP